MRGCDAIFKGDSFAAIVLDDLVEGVAITNHTALCRCWCSDAICRRNFGRGWRGSGAWFKGRSEANNSYANEVGWP